MPGMMDTVLNLGLNDATVQALATSSGDERFAFDSYRRFIQMYSNVVLDIDHHHFEDILEEHKEQRGYMLDTDLDAAEWRRIVEAYKKRVEAETGPRLPAGPARAALGRHRGRLLVLDEPARHHVSAPQHHSGGLGHGRFGASHGVRQHGRDLGHRRRLHAQPLDRRARALWRVPRERAGRRRGGGHPHAAEHHRRGAHRGRARTSPRWNA